MFGHQDDQNNQQDNATDNFTPEPAHDGYLVEGQPAGDDSSNAPAADNSFNPALPAADTPAPTAPATPGTPNDDLLDTGTNALLDIKQHALQELSPLVGHLEQSPEEKFRTTMMMIQASDDQSLIKSAYEAALAIGDEKTKAQALLDIVNEINYFTHQQTGEE